MTWLSKLKNKLTKTSSKISDGLTSVFSGKKIDENTLSELEDLLIMSDMGPQVAAEIVNKLSKEKHAKETTIEDIKESLARSIEAILTPCEKDFFTQITEKPHIILVNGVNGTGKTTTIAKLAALLQGTHKKKVMMVACDTFRAAAVEQLEIWSKKINCRFFQGRENSDPASVAFDAINIAKKENIDVILIDTAGRLQNRKDLMEALQKINRVIKKHDERAPHHSLLIIDATSGQNVLQQIQSFKEMVNINGLIMTKLDGSAKGGVLTAIAKAFALPIFAIGIGEAIDDLKPFNAKSFSEALLDLKE